ncbi:MAG: SMI1/KNR4 family protein [Lacunisphaera sp.]
MNAIERIKAAQQSELIHEDGDPVCLELAPPLSADQINELQKLVGQPLPADLKALLAFCSGLEGCLDGIDFTGGRMSYEHVEVFPNGLPIAADGCGNFWVLDLTPTTTQAAPVFFACHDAPVILYQSPDIASFLSEVFRINVPPHKSLVDDVHDDTLFNVWRRNPGVVDQSTALRSMDTEIKSFASGLTENFQIIDLRNAPVGMGFSWGRYGPDTEIRRHGHELIFAYAKPVKTGLFAGLTSKLSKR